MTFFETLKSESVLEDEYRTLSSERGRRMFNKAAALLIIHFYFLFFIFFLNRRAAAAKGKAKQFGLFLSQKKK